MKQVIARLFRLERSSLYAGLALRIMPAMLASLILSAPLAAHAGGSLSVFASMPADPRAVTVSATGDGVTDDTVAIQAAINKAARATGDAGGKPAGGLVFLPSGRYRISHTILIPSAVRVFGVGPTRPVLVLADRTPGYQKGIVNMVVFTGADVYRTGKVAQPVRGLLPPDDTIYDANSSTFYSAMANVDIEIGDGNPAAAAIRMRTAQHSNLSHMDFHIGSGLAGVYNVGNVGVDLHFFGGRYGILSEKTSPGWQFTLMDSRFEGQRDAAIREHEAAITLVNTSIRDTPVGIEIDRGYGDWLWGTDVHFENVSKAALIISNEGHVTTQVGFQNATARNVPVFAQFRDSGKQVAGGGTAYKVSEFNYGLMLSSPTASGKFAVNMKVAPWSGAQAVNRQVIAALPPTTEWANVHSFGALGDGMKDDTAAIQKAIDSSRVVYLPLGFYIVSQTIHMKPDTVLVGLHPGLTQLALPNGSPAFAGVGAPVALLESASGGNGIVSGIGLATGEVNPRAVALLWKAGEQSLVDDIRIQGGFGTPVYDGARIDPFKKPAGFDPTAYWDRQYPSVWVTDGGGGTFSAIWSPNTFAQAGFMVTNTKTPGHVYELSAEHHIRNEIVLDGVENWEFLAPQTEEEVRDGMDSVSLSVRNSKNILFANYHAYRVTRSIQPVVSAAQIANSSDIRFRNVQVNADSGFPTCDDNGCTTYLRASKFPFENAITDVTHRLQVRQREFAMLDFGARPVLQTAGESATLAKVSKLEEGFHSIAGAAVDSSGKLFFVDRRFQRIYSWSNHDGLAIVRDAPLDPVNLTFDRSGSLMVLSSNGVEGTVYSFKPGSAQSELTVIRPTPVAEHGAARTVVPVNFWQNGEFQDQLNPDTYEFTTLAEMFARDVAMPKAREYVSPDGSLVVPAFRVMTQGPLNHLGFRWSDTLQTHGLVSARAGERVVFTNGSQNRTFSAVMGKGGALTELKQLASRGGESVAVDHAGNLYVADGQVFVYAADGKEIGRIDVPDRPLQLIFGGKDQRTLFILTHHALYSAKIK
jgi:hypothetical protein